ncbi:MAG: hypothetical protein KDD58_07640 [Bdellovibrionales bacterium]|nr:hypothetical protein [Bdellovibrionales bacterium]
MNLLDTKNFKPFSLPFWAATAAALLLSSLPINAKQKASNWSIVKEKAEAQVLIKNRAEAIQLIKEFLEDNTNSSKQAEAQEFLIYISHMFLTENAQKMYYLSRSLLETEPQRAKEKLISTLALEPLNEKVLNELVRLLLRLDDCQLANKYSQQATDQDPYFYKTQLLLLNSFHCLKEWEKFKQTKESLLANHQLKERDKNIINLLEVEKNLHSEESRDRVDRFIEKYPDFPLSYYLQAKQHSNLNKEAKKPAEMYLSICKSQKATVVSGYEDYPRICHYTSEMQTLIK